MSKLPKVPPPPGTLVDNFFIQSLCLGTEALPRVIATNQRSGGCSHCTRWARKDRQLA